MEEETSTLPLSWPFSLCPAGVNPLLSVTICVHSFSPQRRPTHTPISLAHTPAPPPNFFRPPGGAVKSSLGGVQREVNKWGSLRLGGPISGGLTSSFFPSIAHCHPHEHTIKFIYPDEYSSKHVHEEIHTTFFVYPNIRALRSFHDDKSL